MPKGTLKRFATSISPSVAHFLREVTYHASQNEDLPYPPNLTPPATPASLLFFLYEPWRVARGVSSWYKIDTQRIFTTVLFNLNPEICGVPPVQSGIRVGKGVYCLRVHLRKEPIALPASEINPVMREGDGKPLSIASGAFQYPAKRDIPKDLLDTISYLSTCRTKRWNKTENPFPPQFS